jgi:NAD(P)-dependent dehydrogenase (short-subunit alcohol dehydrogenase family)
MTPEKKVAFIPGASRGLELQTACELGRRCILVPIGSRGPEARKAAESLRCDVMKPEDRRAVRDHFEGDAANWTFRSTTRPIFMEREGSCATAGLNRSNIVSSANLDETFEGNFFAPPSDNLLIEVRY